MVLTDKLYKDYLNAHLRLLYFVGLKSGEINKYLSFRDFQNLGYKVKFKCRERINEDWELINCYLNENFESLATSDIKIIEGFKKKISGDFVVVKCLKNYAIFFHTETQIFYEVKALFDRFDKMMSGFPTLIKTTILPYGDYIIYDGFLEPYNLIFGYEMTLELNELYKKSKEGKKIIKKFEN